MGRAITSDQLQIRVYRAKRREAARLAAKLNVTPKPYAKKPETVTVLCNQVGNENVFVRIPVAKTAVFDKIPAATQTALGIKPGNSTLTSLGTGASIVDFTGNHKKAG